MELADDSTKDFKMQIGECMRSASLGDCSTDIDVPKELWDRHGRVWHRSDRPLGKGAFGEVWLGMSGEGMLVAIKTIRLPETLCLDDQDSSSPPGSPRPGVPRRCGSRSRVSIDETPSKIDNLVNEVNILRNTHHECIVNYLACIVTSSYAVVCMEYVAGGTLERVLSDFGALPIEAIRRYTRDILSGLACLHSRGIVHRDLKPDNLLMSPTGRCKLADFGAAKTLLDLDDSVGTPVYMSPEACNGAACCASDIWSLGVIVCQLFTDALPYSFATEPYVAHRFMFKLAKNSEFGPTIPPALVEKDAVSFVRMCFTRDAGRRPTAEMLESCKFVMGARPQDGVNKSNSVAAAVEKLEKVEKISCSSSFMSRPKAPQFRAGTARGIAVLR